MLNWWLPGCTYLPNDPNAQHLVTIPPGRESHIRKYHATAYVFRRLWYKYELRKYSHQVIFTFRATRSCRILVHLFYAKSKSDKTRELSDLKLITTKIGMYRHVHDNSPICYSLPGGLFWVFFIFNQMLSIGSFGTVVPAKSDSDVMFLQSYQGLRIDRLLVY